MKPRNKLAETETSEGGSLILFEHDGEYSISFNGQELVHSKACASEKMLGQVGLSRLDKDQSARILIGGLGLGVTVKSALTVAGLDTRIEVAESIPQVVDWNRDHLSVFNGAVLDDPRVHIRPGDVARMIKKAKEESYDVILLDVDNGPIAMVTKKNTSLYSYLGIRFVQKSLKKGGRAVFWSARADSKFETMLRKADFKVKVIPAKAHERAKKATHMLYVADRRS